MKIVTILIVVNSDIHKIIRGYHLCEITDGVVSTHQIFDDENKIIYETDENFHVIGMIDMCNLKIPRIEKFLDDEPEEKESELEYPQ